MSRQVQRFFAICIVSLILGGFTDPVGAAVNFDSQLAGPPDGDFNSDGVVDAADYTNWRDNLGGATALPNDNGLGTPIATGHYDLWKASYGDVAQTAFAFEDPAIWDPQVWTPTPPVAGPETAPPGSNSIWFAENNSVDVTLVLTDERSGLNGTQAMGTFAYGGETGTNDFNAKFTLVLNNSVTLTAQERSSSLNGEVAATPGTRAMRLGRDNVNPRKTIDGGTTETAPWAILKQNAGTFKYDAAVPASSANMDFSRDRTNSGGALYEISGSATLSLHGAVRLGDRAHLDGTPRTTPGAIFRVRGSNATVNVEDYNNESRLGLWDHDNTVTAENPSGVTHMNVGKFVTEFVLDEGGVSPINVNDNLFIGRTEVVDGNVEIGYGFLRIKLSEPTTAGSGAVGSGNELVLFRADRISATMPEFAGSEIAEGRFFDPDRAGLNSGGTTMLPHAGLWDNGKVRADYAGATYEWTINYFDSLDDGTILDAVTLSNLVVTGTPGDLDGNGSLQAADRSLLVNTIAAPPTINIASAQNLFDLNADDVVDNLDLTLFDAKFTIPGLGSIAAVPEPGTALMCMLGALGFVGVRRRSA